MNEIFHARLLFYTYEDRSRIEAIVQKAVAKGADAVIGGERVLKCMQQYPHVRSLFLRTREDSLRKALHVACRMVYTSQVEKENNAQFLTVLETVYNGVLKVDLEKNITAANHAAAWILNQTEASFIGRKVLSLKKESNLKRLLDYAGGYRYLTIASWALSALSALVALFPFVYIWKVIREILDVYPNLRDAQNLSHNGWMAVLFAVAAILIYVAALMCSHLAAFRVQANIRMKAMHHIVTLPTGFMDSMGSGRVRKIVYESSGATETYLAHQLPDKANALATPVGLLVLLLVFDWRLGLLSLLPVAAAFVIMSVMTGKRMAKKMEEYNNALGQMSNEAVEYVRGISVVKTFGQSVFSFKRFKESIDNYEKWVIAYTKDLRFPMMCYITLVNGIFAVLIAAALVMTSGGVTNEFPLNLMYYIIITPVITLTLTKIMYASENKLIVADAMSRIDSILEIQPLPEAKNPKHPADNSVELSEVSFPDNEAKVQAAFDVLAKGKTVLMIAHRLSTVTGANRIIVIKDGRVADCGTHDELKNRDGLYAKMWEQYNKAANWKVGVSNA